MDTFLEYLMKKKTTGKEMLLKFGIIVLAVIVMFIVFTLLMAVPFLSSFALLGAVAVVYFAYIFLRNFDLEYEYIFTNGELDIDAIKGRKVRKHIASVSCKNIELMADISDANYKAEFENQSIMKKFDAVYDSSKGGIYGIIYSDMGETKMIKFQPPENLVENMKKFNPRCIHKAQ